MLDHYSHSSIQTYQKCPAQFSIRYIDKVEKPDESIEAFLGKRVHEVLEYLYNYRKADKGIPMIDMLLTQFHSVWEDNWHDRIGIANTGQKVQDYYRKGEAMIARFYRQYFPFDEPVKEIEYRIKFFLDETDDYPMVGILDRLDIIGNERVEIHDYKTGKRVMGQRAADNDIQLAIYQLGIKDESYESMPVELVWHFLHTGGEVHSQRSKHQLLYVKRKLMSAIDHINDHIRSEEAFQPKETRLCYWCHYWEECPAKFISNPTIPQQ